MTAKTVLISGAGIAGPALALWLNRYGYQVTIVEKAPTVRGGGFAVDFRGSVHRTVLERMGIWEEIQRRQTHMGGQTIVDAHGKPVVTLPAGVMSGQVEIFRADLAEILYERTREDVEYIFSDSIAALRDTGQAVQVEFDHAGPRTFDLVVGADGLHSRVRKLAFGAAGEANGTGQLKHLGYYTAGFEAPNHLALDHDAQWFNAPGRSISLAHYGGDPERARVSMVFASPELDYDRDDLAQQKRILTERYAGLGWLTPHLLRALDAVQDPSELYFDAIAQVRMNRFYRGRVVLLGDAGYGATMGGMGTGLAMVAAYVLAGELAVRPDHETAFATYEATICGYAAGCQKTAADAGPFLAPADDRQLRRRNRLYRIMTSRILSPLFEYFTTRTAEAIDLRDYPAPITPHYRTATPATAARA